MTGPAKKAVAKKVAPKRRPPKNPRRPAQKSGPIPAVLRGFDRNVLDARWQDQLVPPDPWTEHAPCRRILLCLRSGATWELSCGYARVDPGNAHRWISRGAEAMGGHEDLPALAATSVDDETLAFAAFYVLTEHAKTSPGVGALSTISRAAQGDKAAGMKPDWRAAAKMVAILPQTKRDYAEVTKLEHSGPDGEAIPIEVRAAQLAAQLRARKARQDDEPAEPDTEDVDTAGDG